MGLVSGPCEESKGRFFLELEPLEDFGDYWGR